MTYNSWRTLLHNFSCVLRANLMAKVLLLTIVLLVLGEAGFSQALPAPVPSPNQKTGVPKPAPTPVPNPDFRRWIEMDTISLSTRYRYVKLRNGSVISQNQYQTAIRGRVKFDRNGRYGVVAGLYSGSVLTAGWNNSGWGTGDFQSDTNLKQLYFAAKPSRGLEIQVGGIAPNNGEQSEVIGYDYDAYLTGERVQIRRPKDLWFDEISFTHGYMGANLHPDALRRLKYLNDSNYGQFLVRKQVNKRVGISADYAYEAGRDIFRQAFRIKAGGSGILDNVLFENYERISPTKGYGFNIFADKAIDKKLTLNGGFARIDAPMFNADRFPPGRRVYLGGVYKFTREFSVSGIVIRALGGLPAATTSRTRVDLIFTYNVLELLHRLKIH
jgi:hypothetical protein